jgi:hypothetical protein
MRNVVAGYRRKGGVVASLGRGTKPDAVKIVIKLTEKKVSGDGVSVATLGRYGVTFFNALKSFDIIF